MAGLYPDVPGPRIPYDRSGATAFRLTSDGLSVVAEFTQANLEAWNDNSASAVTASSQGVSTRTALVLAEPHDLVGYCIQYTSGSGVGAITPGVMESSEDTTNGVDGTWSEVVNPFLANHSVYAPPISRSAIQPLALTDVVGLRWLWSVGTQRTLSIGSLHLYGLPTSAGDRLRIWHPTLDQEVGGAYFDWGDTPRSTSADRTFRVKNLSLALTATAPVVSVQALADTNPPVAGQHLLSLDGVNFAATRTLPDLAPGEISGQVTLRRNLAANAVVSLGEARILAVAAGWV